MLTYSYLLHQRETGCHEWLSAPSDPRKPASDSSRVPRSLGWTTQWTLPARPERHASHGHEFFLQTTGATAHQLWLGSLRLSFPAVRRGWMAGKEFRVHGSTCLQESSASRVSTEKTIASQRRSRPPSINYRCGLIFLKICFVFYYERR